MEDTQVTQGQDGKQWRRLMPYPELQKHFIATVMFFTLVGAGMVFVLSFLLFLKLLPADGGYRLMNEVMAMYAMMFFAIMLLSWWISAKLSASLAGSVIKLNMLISKIKKGEAITEQEYKFRKEDWSIFPAISDQLKALAEKK